MQRTEVKITVLLENKVICEGLACEHGLSFYIETSDQKLLFDTGQTDLFLRNAEKLGIQLADADQLILSHGHYDHTGGLYYLCQLAPDIKISAHPDIVKTRYSIRDKLKPKSNGIPDKCLKVLSERGFSPIEGPTQITRQIQATGEIPRLNDYEDVGGPFYIDPRGADPDEIKDDQALWFNTRNGLVIVLGCAHSGIINTIEYCKKLSGVDKVHALIGGFHLVNANEDRIEGTLEALKGYNLDILSACHCTGDTAVSRMQLEFPDSFEVCGAGSIYEFEC